MRHMAHSNNIFLNEEMEVRHSWESKHHGERGEEDRWKPVMESLGVKQGAGRGMPGKGALLELWTESGPLVSWLRLLRSRRWKEKDVEGFSEFCLQKK